ncbi:hypothetical protein DE146DRAFT_640672 [Phaeosphaeria sp. MPI-PUGE-AT-0046c]|nr:hypothetical protein DE146DRAFT_640672 [Phaeosphaeria sp. MPI-PUGE-AT-0046c]
MMVETDSPGNALEYSCLYCSKKYKNKNHLRRHELSHTTSTSYRCEACTRDFARYDALRRHHVTCRKQDGNERRALPALARGRRQRACHACRSRKLRCDRNRPCGRCLTGGINCDYISVTDHRAMSSHVPMTFLLNYTNPALESVSDAFAISGAHAKSADILDGQLFGNSGYMNDGLMDDLFSDIFPNANPEPVTLAHDEPAIVMAFPSTDPLHHRTDELVSLLQCQYKATPSALSLLVNQFPADLAKAVFSSDNITAYASAFFTYFQPHTPFIHRPSVDLQTVSSHLLLTITLLGSVFAVPTDDALAARCFFGLAEEYIFVLLRERIIRDVVSSDDSIGLIQAAVLIHALQVNSNHEGVRHRIRVHRFPEIMAAVRKLGLFGMICTKSYTHGSWQDYVHDEIKIRLAARLFLTDCMSTLFFKTPPQITLVEMRGNVPSTDDMFEAQDPDEFARLDSSSMHLLHRQGLDSLIKLFLQDDWAGSSDPRLANLESEHLILLIFAFHSMIFICRTGLHLSSTSSALLRATARWKEIWHEVKAKENAAGKASVGFAKYGLELWWLAQKILESGRSGDTQSAYMSGTVTDSLDQLHEFIRRYARQ